MKLFYTEKDTDDYAKTHGLAIVKVSRYLRGDNYGKNRVCRYL